MPTQLIAETKRWIDHHLTTANTLALTTDLIGDAIANSFAKVLGKPTLEMEEVSVSIADSTVTLGGKAAFGNAGAVAVTVEIKDVAGAYHIAILFQEMQIPANLDASLSSIWNQLDIPAFFADFKIAGIEFPSIEHTFSILAEQSKSFGLAGDKIVIGPSAKAAFQVSNLSSAPIDIHVDFSAPIAIGSLKFRLEGELSTDDAVDSRLAIKPIVPAAYPSLGELMEIFFGAGVQLPDGLAVAGLQLGDFFQKDAFTLSMRFKETWKLALGPAGLAVRDISTTVVWSDEKLTGSLQGTVTVAGLDVKIDSNLKEKLTLHGKLPTIKITSLIEVIAGRSLPLPTGFPEIELPEAEFFIPTQTEPLSFLVRTTAGDYGTVWLLVTKMDGEWQAAVAFSLSDDWKFSRLSNLLAPLDRLRISKPTLTLATFSKPELSFPVIDGAALQLALSKGISLNTDLMLHGFGLDFVRFLIGQEKLPLLLTIGDSLSKTEVQAELAGGIELLPGVIVFEQIFLRITPEPFAIALAARADVTIFRQELPKFSVSVGIEEGRTEIELETVEPWKNPLGISGLTINKVALQIKTSPAPQYGILGEIAVSDKVIMMAAQFTGAAPSMIAGELKGTLSLQEVIRDLVGLSLPLGILDISITDFKVRAVADPLGVTIGGVTFEPGLALQGTIGFFGLKAFTKVVIEPDKGVYAHAALSEKIDLGGVLIISNAEGDGPAFFTLDTRQSPFLVVSGKVSLLGLGESIEAVVGTDGINIAIKGDLGGVAHYEWSCRVKSLNNFEANGSFKCALKGSIGPIRLAPGTPSLGTIRIDTGFQGSASVSVINNQFASSIQGGFYFQGISLNIPEIELRVAPASLEKLPDIIWKQIQDNAKDIFTDFLNDADKWLLALRDGLVEGVEHVALVLRDQFNRTAEQIGKDIRDTLKMGSLAAAQGLKEIGEGVEQIADVLKKLGDPIGNVKEILQLTGFSSNEISKALQISFGIPHADWAARGHIDFPAQGHADFPAQGHADFPGKGHADFPGNAHADFQAKGHIDIPRKGHADFPAKAHIDVRSQGHADFWSGHIDSGGWIHGDFKGIHGDTKLTPHGDTKLTPHGDMPAIPHGDVRAKLHGDTPLTPHGDTPLTPHGDTPLTPHGDMPTIPHGDAP